MRDTLTRFSRWTPDGTCRTYSCGVSSGLSTRSRYRPPRRTPCLGLLPPAPMADVEKLAEKQMSFDNNEEVATIIASNDELGSSKADSPADSSQSPFPDGGLDAWLTVFGAFLALFCTFGQLNSFGTFQTWYAEHQLRGLPPSTISWIGSLQLWIFFFSVRIPCDRSGANETLTFHTC